MKRFLAGLRTAENALLVALIAALLILSCSQIVLRNLFDSGIPWLDPAARVLVLWLALIAAGIATRDKQHLSIDLTHFLPKHLILVANRLVSLVGAIICGVIAYFSIELIEYEYEDGLIAFAQVPVWLTEVVIPASFALMAVRFAIQVVIPGEEEE